MGGYDHRCAMSTKNNVRCFGFGGGGQLGSGSTANIGDTANSMGANLTSLDFGPDFNVSAVSKGGGGNSGHHCVAADDAAFKCWGFNGVGQLGLGDVINRGENPGEMGAALSFVQFAFT